VAVGAVCVAGCAVLVYFLPLFHVVPLERVVPTAAGTVLDPVAFADRFWKEQLIPSGARATDASQLLAAVQQDRQSARRAYGRSVGIGSVYYYFVAGTGRVVAVEKDCVGLSLGRDPSQVEVRLKTGNIFGNAVRDGTGLLDVNEFPNSQDFNALSSEINGLIEKRVLPSLRAQATLGVTVRFVGCAEIRDEDRDLHPLQVVPFIVEVP
jgi:predicted lipoprotein